MRKYITTWLCAAADPYSESPERSASVSMMQSDSEGEPGAEDKPKYPYQRIYWDAEDKRRIDALPVIERENKLADRYEEVERYEQDRALRQMMIKRAGTDSKKGIKEKKRTASTAELEESPRKSSRQRKTGKDASAIARYRQQREERNQPREGNEMSTRVTSYDDDYSSEDARDDSDVEHRRPIYRSRRSPSPTREDPVAEFEDVQRARIGRDNFAQVCFNPKFEDTVTGCFARVCLGPGRTPGVNEYRLCSIKGIKTGRPYVMEPPNGRKFITDQYIIAAHGKAERPWSFLECSMSKFTEDEFRRYRVTMANEDCKMPTQGTINKKLGELGHLIAYKPKFNDDINARMVRMKAVSDKVYRTQEREALTSKLVTARARGKDDLMIELEEQLANLVPIKLAFGTTMGEKAEASVKAQQASKLAELNRRNEKQNAENVRKAQLAEMHARKARKHLHPGVDDLFEGGSDISRAGTPVNGMGTPKLGASLSRAGTPVPTSQANGAVKLGTPANGTPRSGTPVPLSMKTGGDRKKGGLPVIRKAALDDEILADMDLGIDIDI